MREALAALQDAEALFPDQAEMPERIGPYRVLEQLGRGGMGRVFRVEDTRAPGQPYALKWMNPIALLNPRSRERFTREAEVLGKLDVPGVVRVYEVAPAGENPYVVMELVEGESLADRLTWARREKSRGDPADGSADAVETALLPASQHGPDSFVFRASAWVARLARTIEELHAHGVLHRDLKPGNVLLRHDGAPVVVDFGLAAVEDATTLTHTGDLLGTPNYMAPEQAMGRGADVRTDVYALGAILYELLTLRPPHAGSDHAGVLEAIKSEAIVPARRLRSDVPQGLTRVLERALAFRREERYSSAAQLAQDLEALAAGRAVRARRSWSGRLRDLHRVHPRVALGSWLGLGAVAIACASFFLAQPGEDPQAALQRALDRATIAYAGGDADAARAEAERILKLDPSNRTAEFLMLGGLQHDSDDPLLEALTYGETYRRQGKLRQAEAAYRRAMKLAPESPLPVILLGKVATEIGERTDRVPELLASIAQQPRSVALYLSLGEAYLLQERWREAVEAYARAEANAERPMAGILLPQSRALHGAGESASALATLRRVITEAGVDGGELTPTLEWFVKERGEGEAICTLLRELLEKDPTNVNLMFALATAYDWDDRIYEAARYYTAIIERDPTNTRTLACLMHLHSGANRDTCAQCAAAFVEHPELYDPGRALEYSLRLLELVGRQRLSTALFVVDVAIRIGRLDALETRLEEMQRETSSEEESASIGKALAKLRGYRETHED